jgi:hypothetical protein
LTRKPCGTSSCRYVDQIQNEDGRRAFPIKTLLTAAGVILLLAGLVFMGQGSRYFPYPAESFMVGASQWVYYGGAIAIVGLIVLVIGWRS